jgi:hypothetical protein
MRFPNRWTVGQWTFYEIEDHGFTGDLAGRSLFAFGDGSEDDRGRPKFGEMYASLDRAMVAAVGEKYTGPRGAGGRGVGTAADWFMKMIGADDLVAVDYQSGQQALAEIVSQLDAPTNLGRTRQAAGALEARGLVLATMVDPPKHSN